jgi:hypothetical protein
MVEKPAYPMPWLRRRQRAREWKAPCLGFNDRKRQHSERYNCANTIAEETCGGYWEEQQKCCSEQSEGSDQQEGTFCIHSVIGWLFPVLHCPCQGGLDTQQADVS